MIPSPLILLIDDDLDLLDAHRSLLERAGYRVMIAADGQAGLEIARKHRPQLAIVDLMMPGVSGFGVLDLLKEELGNSIRLIMLTGNAAEAHRRYAEFLGAEEYLAKPISFEKLLQLIQQNLPVTAPQRSQR